MNKPRLWITIVGFFLLKGILLQVVYAESAKFSSAIKTTKDRSFLSIQPEPSLASIDVASNVSIPSSSHASSVVNQFTPVLKRQLESKGLKFGGPILIRIFKVPSILEVWVKKEGKFVLFKTYNICRFSGQLGPKLKNGDKQSPEGFYSVAAGALNPNSSYFLSFNLGYPNEYDRYHGRTGSLLMVHGECASIGCYAMTNTRMSEIYTLMYGAFKNGQKAVQVQSYPFALTNNNMRKMQRHPFYGFWLNLKQGYDAFEKSHKALQVTVNNGRYQFGIDG